MLDPKFAHGSPMPSSVGLAADLYKEVNEVRLAMEKEVAAIQKRETEIKNWIIDNLSKSSDTGAAGLRYRAQIKMKDIPRITSEQTDEGVVSGWPAFYAYVQETGNFNLLQKRLSEGVIMEMIAAGETPPGVAIYREPTVSITKIG